MNIDNITSRVKKISQDTMAEMQKMNEIRQLNSSISAEKKKIHSTYTEIGKKLYDCYRDTPLEEFESEFHSLDEAFERIDTLRAQVRQVKGVTLCPNCNAEVGVNERFCSNCGSKMPEIFKIQDDTPVNAAEEPASEEASSEANISDITEASATVNAAADTEGESNTAECADTKESAGTVDEPDAAESADAVDEPDAVESTDAVDEPDAVESTDAVDEPDAVESAGTVDESDAVESAGTVDEPAAEKPETSEERPAQDSPAEESHI